ncbi:MAG: RES family NAD+ phosphorylase [Candidatus Rokuibacteriota bacterium]
MLRNTHAGRPPPDWTALRPGPASMKFGTRWVQEKRSLILYVPSAIVPEETNGLLNPNHPEFGDAQHSTLENPPGLNTQRMSSSAGPRQTRSSIQSAGRTRPRAWITWGASRG